MKTKAYVLLVGASVLGVVLGTENEASTKLAAYRAAANTTLRALGWWHYCEVEVAFGQSRIDAITAVVEDAMAAARRGDYTPRGAVRAPHPRSLKGETPP